MGTSVLVGFARSGLKFATALHNAKIGRDIDVFQSYFRMALIGSRDTVYNPLYKCCLLPFLRPGFDRGRVLNGKNKAAFGFPMRPCQPRPDGQEVTRPCSSVTLASGETHRWQRQNSD
jgi:hypothetical protein